MKGTVAIAVALACASLAAEPAAETWEATVGVSPEAVARYSAPGDPARYKALLLDLRKPRETLGTPSTQLRMPVRSFPNGREEVVLHAEQGWISLDMMKLRGVKVRVETFDEAGNLVATLWADEAAVDRATKLAAAKGRVRLVRGGDTLTGNGALADLGTRYVRVLRDAQIETGRLKGADLTRRGMF